MFFHRGASASNNTDALHRNALNTLIEERLRENEAESRLIQQRQEEILREREELQAAAAETAAPTLNKQELIQTMEEQMREMRALFARRFNSANNASDDGTDRTDVSTSDYAREDLGVTRSPRGFRQLVFGRKLKPTSAKKQYIDQIDDEIATLRQDLKDFQVSAKETSNKGKGSKGNLENEEYLDLDIDLDIDLESQGEDQDTAEKKAGGERRPRSKSPSWKAFGRKKSPAAKRSRHVSPKRG